MWLRSATVCKRQGLLAIQRAHGHRCFSSVASSLYCSNIDSSRLMSSSLVASMDAPHGQVLNQADRQGGYNFASSQYATAFRDLPLPDTDALRKSTLRYLDEEFNAQSWYDHPIRSILKGEKLAAPGETALFTSNAMGKQNGLQYHATPSQVQDLMDHIKTYQSPYNDIRPQLRRIEQRLLTEYAGFLIGNQCLDFQKQDGITELEESIMANAVERNLNDMLLQEENEGKVSVNRKPIYVSCVSNFTNFLDLFRKTIRNLELGVPCVVLGRSNTVQHSFRWTELLVDLMRGEGLDLGMVTYLSCKLDDIKLITSSCKERTGMLYSTCSRELAENIKSNYPNTIASTGGPNTLLTTEWTDGVQDAIRMSAAIESSGQCTALRHCVVPDTVTGNDVENLFDPVKPASDATESLRSEMFDGIFEHHEGSLAPDVDKTPYTKHSTKDVYYKVGSSLPDDGIEEYWRKAVVDISTTAVNDVRDTSSLEKVKSLAKWLNRNQPISLAMNAPRKEVFEIGNSLFEKTAMVVNTVGSTDDPNAPPALTCQARPQEAEVFGEFPPRKELNKYTKYPVIVPSSTPSYDTVYQPAYLESLTINELEGDSGSVAEIITDLASKEVRGYCIELLNYLKDVTSDNPKLGFGTSRTALWGLQRPPLLDDMQTCIRCNGKTSLDDVAPTFLPFHATNARSQVELSIDESNEELLAHLKKHGVDVTVESNDTFNARMAEQKESYYNVVTIDGPMDDFPLVGQFVSLFFPLGHIKSTMSNDKEFVEFFKKSGKWLKSHSD